MTTSKHIRLAKLNLLVREFGSLAKLAELVGTSAAYLSQIRNEAASSTGRPRGIGDALARRIEESLGKPVGWMDRPLGEYENALAPAPADLPNFGLPAGTFKRVEVVDEGDPRYIAIPKVRLRLTAGISTYEVEPYLDDDSTAYVPIKWIRARGFNSAHLIAIDVRGESMEPTFYAGDTVVLNTADKEPIDGGVFAINYEGAPVVKRMMRDAGEWWLTSDNMDQRKHPRKMCGGERCIVIGKVVRKETERF